MDQNVTTDPTSLAAALEALYGDAGQRGAYEALQMLPDGVKVSASMSGLVGGMDWSNWKPGNPDLTNPVTGQMLKQITLKRADTAAGIVKTAKDNIAARISEGITAGDSYTQIAAGIAAELADPGRADLIAATEVGRAFNAAAADEMQAAGLDQFDWLAYDDACPECAEMEDANPHDFNDEMPPEHPNCRCTIVPVGGDGAESDVVQSTSLE